MICDDCVKGDDDDVDDIDDDDNLGRVIMER